MSRRGVVAGIILVLWVAGLGALMRREYFRPSSERLAIAALSVAPGATYFLVERDEQHVGYASSTLDTTATAIEITDLLTTGGGSGSDTGRVVARATAELSRALVPRRFTLGVEGTPLPLAVTGVAEGDTALLLTVTSGSAAGAPQRVATRGATLPPTVVPLFVALGDQRRVGGRLAVTLFDPMAMGARDVVLRVVAESLFTVSDSAVFDAGAGRWVSAHQDTVRAWRVVPEGDATSLTGWVDAQGRVVEVTYPGGYVLRRTSFEEAAENWRRGRTAP